LSAGAAPNNLGSTDPGTDDFGFGTPIGKDLNLIPTEDAKGPPPASAADPTGGAIAKKDKKPPAGPQMRVVVVIGPTKTASTHEKHFLASHVSYLRRQNWTWPRSPTTPRKPGGWNDFSDLPHLLQGRWKHYNAPQTLEWYRQEFVRVQKSGTDLVFGSEHFMSLRNNVPAIEKFVAMMPPRSSLTVTVNYRRPRALHVKSLYKQMVNMRTVRETRPFSTWLCDNDIRRVVSPGHAAAWLAGGSDVVMVDMEATYAGGGDVVDVLLCDVLGTKCTNNIPDGVPRKDITHRDHALTAEFDIKDEAVFAKIETLLLRADCGYAEYLAKAHRRGRFRIYPQSNFFEICKTMKSINEDQLQRQIQLIPELGCRNSHKTD